MRNTLFICMLLVLASCSKDSSTSVTTGSSSGDIMPLKVGNVWYYRETLLDSSGHTISIAADTIKLTRDTLISGEHWFDSGAGLFTNRSDGLYIWERSTSPQYLMAKYPASQNDKFVTVNGDSATVVGTTTVVTVPLGTYGCYEYLVKGASNGRAKKTLFFAPGKGLIRQDLYTTPYAGSTYVSDRVELQLLLLN